MGRGRCGSTSVRRPGVGKTVAMLDEAHRRLDRGTDVVVGLRRDPRPAAHRGAARRPRGGAAAPGEHRGAALTELDVDAVLARRPAGRARRRARPHQRARAARTRSAGRTSSELLDAGIDVISTVNIQHLESLNDVVESITGVRQQETVPDEVVRAADQIELVDMSPEALRRRMAHGNIYGRRPGRRRPGQLLPGRQPLGPARARAAVARRPRRRGPRALPGRPRASRDQWPARERVVVALTGGAGSETLLRRGARIASRAAGGELLACHVQSAEGLASTDPAALARLRRLAGDLGARVPRRRRATTSPRRSSTSPAASTPRRSSSASAGAAGWQQILRPSIASEVADRSGDIDVHLVPHERLEGRPARRRAAAGLRQRVGSSAGCCCAVVALVALTAVLVADARGPRPVRSTCCSTSPLTVVCRPRRRHLAGALLRRRRLARRQLVLHRAPRHPDHQRPTERAGARRLRPRGDGGLSVVNVAARRTEQAISAERESSALAAMSRDLLAEPRPLPALLEHARDDLGMRVRRAHRVAARTGRRGSSPRPTRSCRRAAPLPADDDVGARRHRRRRRAPRCSTGRPWRPRTSASSARTPPTPRSCTDASSSSRAAREAAGLARDNAARTALLAAVSHDLRTPLASIKAGVSTPAPVRADCRPRTRPSCSSRSRSRADRLDALIGNLLDLSRLRDRRRARPPPLGRPARRRRRRPCARRPTRSASRSTSSRTCPLVRADPGLLDRVLANVVENALRHSGDAEVAPHGGAHRRTRVAAAGHRPRPGRRPTPTRSASSPPSSGVGDAPQRRRARPRAGRRPRAHERMGGTLVAEDTPGGGLTMVVDAARLLAAPRPPTAAERARDPSARRRRRPAAAAHAVDRLRAHGNEVVTAARRPHRGAVGGRGRARRRHPRPRAARPRRHRGAAPHPRRVASCPSSCCRPGTSPTTRSRPSTSAPTTTSRSPSASTSCSPGCARPCARGGDLGRHLAAGRHRPLHPRLRRAARDGRTARTCGSRPTEWRLLEALCREPGHLVHAAGPAPRRLGSVLRARVELPARLRQPAAPQARARPGQPAPPRHRARPRLPLQPLTVERPRSAASPRREATSAWPLDGWEAATRGLSTVEEARRGLSAGWGGQ